MRSDKLERYILWQVLTSTLMVFAIVGAVVMLVDYVELLRTLDAAPSATPADVMWLTLMKAPNILVLVAPFMFMFGTLATYVRLNRRSELVVMRASGMSAWSFIRPAALLAAFFGCLATLTLAPAASMLDGLYEQKRDALLARHDPQKRDGDVWLRQTIGSQQLVIRGSLEEDIGRTLVDATVFVFETTPEGPLRFVRRLEAETAILKSGFWQLRDIEELAPGAPKTTLQALALPTTLRDADLQQQMEKSKAATFWQLPRLIDEMQAAGFATHAYELKWHQSLASPFLYAGMSILAAAFALRLSRMGGLVGLASLGAGAGFAVYFLNDVFGAFATATLMTPAGAAWIPPMVAVLSGFTILTYTEDG